MGSGRNRKPSGGFYTYEWEAELEQIAGIKVVSNYSNQRSDDLPAFANTSSMYFKRDSKTGKITQLRIYDKSRAASLDIDINPKKGHRNSDGTIIQAGITHVHEWKRNSKGELIRNKNARLLTASEILLYDTFLSAAEKNIRYQ